MNAGSTIPVNFEFASAARIIFGAGKFADVPDLALGYGKRILIVTGGRSADALTEKLISAIIVKGGQAVRFQVGGEPEVSTIQHGLAFAKEHGADVVIGLGGGSAMDTAKCLSGLLTNDGDLFDYLEVIGKGQPLKHAAAPCLCIPTTAGTGSEVTRNAVISAPGQRVKASMRSPLMLAKIALIDPELTYALPPDVTAYTGLDALTQLIEPYTSRRANPITDAIARSGLVYVASLLDAYTAAQNQTPDEVGRKAREHMALASLSGGLALANSGLGAVHGFAAVIGARYPIPHGAVCGILLPHVVSANQDATRDLPGFGARWQVITETLAPLRSDAEETLSETLIRLTQTLNMPGLAHYGVLAEHLPELVALAQKASSMKANPVDLPAETLMAILQAAL